MSASIVARGEAPPILDASEEVLDLVVLTIEVLVIDMLDFAMFEGWDTGFDAALGKGVSEPVAVIRLVAQQNLGSGQAG